ncbi:hypothetical protein [Brevundimonas sp.]|jgi:hypothetical protein
MRQDDGDAGKAIGFGCLAVVLLAGVAAAALWVIFVWDVNQT